MIHEVSEVSKVVVPEKKWIYFAVTQHIIMQFGTENKLKHQKMIGNWQLTLVKFVSFQHSRTSSLSDLVFYLL